MLNIFPTNEHLALAIMGLSEINFRQDLRRDSKTRNLILIILNGNKVIVRKNEIMAIGKESVSSPIKEM